MLYGYLDDRFIPQEDLLIEQANPGFQYGYGVFETIKVSAGQPIWVAEHFQRLKQSAEKLDIGLPVTRQEFSAILSELLCQNDITEGSIKVIVVPVERDLMQGDAFFRGRVMITCKKGKQYTEDMYSNGFRVKIVTSVRRNEKSILSNIKSLNFTDNMLAKREVRKAGFDEGIFLNTAGYLAEGTVSNIFWYDGCCLKTPAVSAGILPGIARSKVIQAARSMNIPVREVLAEPAELNTIGEVFLTNSLVGVMPVTTIGNTIVGNGMPGELTWNLVKCINGS